MNALLASVIEGAVRAISVPARAARGVWQPFSRLGHLIRLTAMTDGRVPATTQFDGRVFTVGRVRLRLGGHCRLGRFVLFETEGGTIVIGSRTRINTGSVIVAHDAVTIGADCLIGEYVSIRDADHGTGSDVAFREQPCVAKPVTIGDNVWVGRGTVILKGVTIGTGAVVGANSVVTRDVPAFVIAAGVPARVIKSLKPAECRDTSMPKGGA